MLHQYILFTFILVIESKVIRREQKIHLDCPEGFVLQDYPVTKCLKYVATPSNYFSAEITCVREGGDLISILNIEENSYLNNYIPHSTLTWIGYNNVLNETWGWVDGQPTEITAWAMGYDPSSISQRCTAYINTDWRAHSCEEFLPFICGMEPTISKTTVVPTTVIVTAPTTLPSDQDKDACIQPNSSQTQNPVVECPPCSQKECAHCEMQNLFPELRKRYFCPDGWSHFRKSSSCYKVFFNATFDQAEENCNAYNAHLTSIQSEAENEFIVELAQTGLPQYQSNQIWVGVQRDNETDRFFNTDLTKMSYENWADGQPDNFEGREGCVEDRLMTLPVQIYADPVPAVPYSQGKWNDCPCEDLMRAYVCKLLLSHL